MSTCCNCHVQVPFLNIFQRGSDILVGLTEDDDGGFSDPSFVSSIECSSIHVVWSLTLDDDFTLYRTLQLLKSSFGKQLLFTAKNFDILSIGTHFRVLELLRRLLEFCHTVFPTASHIYISRKGSERTYSNTSCLSSAFQIGRAHV